jgi:homoserine kinase
VEIVEITGDDGRLSRDAMKNVASRAAADVLDRAGSRQGLRLWLHKQMPVASGLGSSGASSAAGAVAANEILGRPLSRRDVVSSAIEGECAASGTPHADNVAPSVMGGFVLVRSCDPLDIVELPVPEGLRVAVVHPHYQVSTAEARRLVNDRTYGLDVIVPNIGSVAALVAALYRSDLPLLGRSIDDRIIEPLRATLIPGFGAVKNAALGAGALACSIAGSGPSLFAFADSDTAAQRAGTAMQEAFKAAAGLQSDLFWGKVSTEGARVI